MDPLLSSLVLILLALLGARFSFSSEAVPAGPRLLFRTGTHFLFFGFLAGTRGTWTRVPGGDGGALTHVGARAGVGRAAFWTAA